MKRNIKGFILGGFLASSLGALAVNIPNSFSAGTAIKASDVNANFSSLKTAVDALEGGSGVKVPLNLTGAGTGIAGSTLIAQNTNGGIGASVSQSKVGASDGALVVIQSGDGPILKGFGKNSGNEDFRVDTNGSVVLSKPDGTDNIVLDNVAGNFKVPYATIGKRLDVKGSLVITGDPCCGQVFNAVDSNGVGLVTIYQSGDLGVARNVLAQAFNVTSDRNAKTNFSSINALEVLKKVSHLNIQTWNYKTDAGSLRHVGPMAQDFHAAFGFNGGDDKHISVVDSQGVALAAIQGLNTKLETENAVLRKQLSNLEQRLSVLERK